MVKEVTKGFTSNNHSNQLLPPKGPWIAGIQETGSFSGWSNHQRPCSSAMGFVNGSSSNSWLDEFIMDEGPSKRASYHRRCASDSLAFLEDHIINPCSSPALVFGEDLESRGSSAASLPRIRCRDSDGIDEEHLFSMFADIEPFHHQKEAQPSVGQIPMGGAQNQISISDNPSTPSDHNSISEPCIEMTQVKNENEAESEIKSTTAVITDATPIASSNVAPPHVPSIDQNIDPKRVKRILANRQSAQRSRVRKLQYIAELERSVNGLQAEVSSLSPQVAYLDHQRLVLNGDNSALKQRIAALAQDKIFKDAHSEHLKKEATRLRQLYQQQYLHKEQQQLQEQSAAFEAEQQQQQQVNVKVKIESSKISQSQQQMVKPSSCLVGKTNKSLDEIMLTTGGKIATYPSDYMVQNP